MDEGLDESLARIRDAGIHAISVTTSYHAGMVLTPHNPRQKVHLLEGGVYYRAQEDGFGRIKPLPSAWLEKQTGDPLATVVEAARRHDLHVIGWTVTLHNTRLG